MASYLHTGNCRCMFCWDILGESDLAAEDLMEKFLKCLGNYLGVQKWRDKEREVDFGGKFGACEGCGRITQRFCELFGELSRIRLEIDAGLEVLVGKMRRIEGTEEDDHGKGLEDVKKLRAEIRGKCFEKVSKGQARVCLEKLKLNTAKMEEDKVMEVDKVCVRNEKDSADDHSMLDNCPFDVHSDGDSDHDVEEKFCPEEQPQSANDPESDKSYQNETDGEKSNHDDVEWQPEVTRGENTCTRQAKLKCQFCYQKEFTWKGSLMRHYRNWHSMNRIQAQSAFKARNSTVQKQDEIKVEYRSMYKCTRCSKFVITKSGLLRHFKVTHSMSPDEAKITFEKEKPPLVQRKWQPVYKTSLQKYINSVKSKTVTKTFNPGRNRKGAFSCPVSGCNEILSTSEELDKHGQLHGSFSCIFCSEVKTFAPDLATHELEAHSENPEDVTENKCRQCLFVSPYRNNYITHHLEAHQGLSLKIRSCPICQANFLNRPNILSCHMRTQHGNLKPDDLNAKKCNHEGCLAYFLRNRQLLAHKRRVHGVDDRKFCPECGKELSSFAAMQTHRRLKHGHDDENPDLPFGCQVPGCKKRFVTLKELSIHKEFCCPTRRAAEFVKCPECNRDCKGSEGLRTHMKIHKRKFVCELCGKEFAKRCILERHALFHLSPEEWKYECQECGKKCQTIYTLRNHMQIHSGEKPFLCEECGNRYANRDKWKKHLERVHGVEVPTRKKAKPQSVSKREPVK